MVLDWMAAWRGMVQDMILGWIAAWRGMVQDMALRCMAALRDILQERTALAVEVAWMKSSIALVAEIVLELAWDIVAQEAVRGTVKELEELADCTQAVWGSLRIVLRVARAVGQQTLQARRRKIEQQRGQRILWAD
jgi:hypothetical protein